MKRQSELEGYIKSDKQVYGAASVLSTTASPKALLSGRSLKVGLQARF